jgi:hypothetical protein
MELKGGQGQSRGQVGVAGNYANLKELTEKKRLEARVGSELFVPLKKELWNEPAAPIKFLTSAGV